MRWPCFIGISIPAPSRREGQGRFQKSKNPSFIKLEFKSEVHLPPIRALQEWQLKRPGLFNRRVINHRDPRHIIPSVESQLAAHC